MRLLERDASGEIHHTSDFLDHEIPRYAILSHTWGAEEVLFQDLKDGTGKNKLGYDKIRFCAGQAWKDGLEFCWVDTCCIDKPNNTELQEAINSMFRWYRDAAKCYVFLSDVSTSSGDAVDEPSWGPSFRKSRWFTRGWTLQELIAPVSVEFFSREGVRLGTRKSLEHDIHNITGLPLAVLRGNPLSHFSISERLAWAEKRDTTKKEDRAYSLLGLFGIHMAPLYGEGEPGAFRRLRKKIETIELPRILIAHDAAFKPQTAHPSKRRNLGSLIGEERSATGLSGANSDSFDATTKQSLVDQLYFAKIDERLTSLTTAQGKTCRWFLAKPEYKAWSEVIKQSDDGGFLWIKGNPGTGKSTLMKLLFEEAKLRTKDDPSQIMLSFFFLARGTIEEKSTIGLYRSLLHQLFDKAVDLRDSLEWMTADGAKGIQRNGWYEAALQRTLTEAIPKLRNRSLTIFVDALDECNQDQAAGMVCFFEELCDHARGEEVQLRICFSSRHYPTVVIQKGIEITLEDEAGHTDDIEHYIKSKLRLGKAKHADSLRSEIRDKSSGIFLWVVLVLDILKKEYPNSIVSINAIRTRLKQIPPGLDDLFEMILKRDEENLEQLHICLKWVLFATRPLKPQEFYFAVQLSIDKENSSYWDEEDIELDQMRTFVRTSSKGLAEVTRNKASEVQFIHESVRDFLLGRYVGKPQQCFRKACHSAIYESSQTPLYPSREQPSAPYSYSFPDSILL
ncbi:heterokaryon incompatibility protein-domain-containing protein [Diaporthe sp. PMI_573]|nr:heterokaryon incompatibility protein-domain-containing protein [Diaporthaceae sp. PMI_573]